MNKIIQFLILCICFGLTSACSERHDSVSDFRDLSSEGWPYGEEIPFATAGLDTCGWHKLEIAVRHSASYPFTSLWLELILKNGDRMVKDTVEMKLSDSYGRWKGKGFGSTYQMAVPIAKRYKLDDSTRLSLRHIMRTDTLHGIRQVGIVISPA